MNAKTMNNTSRTDWARIDAMSDEDIDTSDIPPLSEEFFAKSQLRMPRSPIPVSVLVDPNTLAWFQAQGKSAEQQMSIALRIYAEAHKANLVTDDWNPRLQQSVLNLSRAFINFFDGRAKYPNLKNHHGRQSTQYPQNVKALSDGEIKFPRNLGVDNAKVYRELVGEFKTVTVSSMTNGCYYIFFLIDDGVGKPEVNK